MHKTILTKQFSGLLQKMKSAGHTKSVQAVRAAMSEASTDGKISLPRTKHGETRLPNIEKYDLPDAHRLVVQLVDGVQKTRAFLFVGDHDDAEHWLDTHRNYKWVKKDSDGTLDFVLISEQAIERYIPGDRLDLSSSDEVKSLPLLRALRDGDWKTLNVSEAAKDYTLKITGSSFEQDPYESLEQLDVLVGYDKASLIFDLLWHAHKQEWDGVSHRLSLLAGGAHVVDEPAAAAAMASPDNSESFLTFDDQNLLDEFLSTNTLSDWMLFLHRDQKAVVEKDLRGPARLRGVSGSGKTSVLIHRAKYLARKYQQPVLLVTLTESMRKLLDRLADDLCSYERGLIETKTMGMLAKDVVYDICGAASFPTTPPQDWPESTLTRCVGTIQTHADIGGTYFQGMPNIELKNFLRDELTYVRGRLTEDNLGLYTDTKKFPRTGRGTPLSQAERRIVYTAIELYVGELKRHNYQDHDGLISIALQHHVHLQRKPGRYRCILCDEVQDLSELDITLLGKINTTQNTPACDTENGLFLAGDGAQSIYKKGFSLRRVGIDIQGRSFTLKKNYRNTHEILQAAFSLVSQFEFSDLGEEQASRPSIPDFAKRHGTKPMLLRCANLHEEALAIAKSTESLLTMGHTPGQICIIGTNVKSRDEVKRELDALGIETCDLKQDVDYESDCVKVSTIESAKGHEFCTVFIMHLIDGIIPKANPSREDLTREAARLYVGMTRARENLTLTYSGENGATPSRFIPPIAGDCEEGLWRDGEIRRV